MPAKKKAAKAAPAKREVKRSPKQKEMTKAEVRKFQKKTKIDWDNVTKNLNIKLPKTKKGKRSLEDKIRETFRIKDILPGKDLTHEHYTEEPAEVLRELLGDQEPSKPISRNKKQAEKEDAFKQLLSEMFPTLNAQIKAAEETLKCQQDPRDRKARSCTNRNLFESEMSILNQIVSDLHRLIQFNLQAGQYDNIVEYSQLLVSFADKAKAVKPIIGKRIAQPLPGTGLSRSHNERDKQLDQILVKGKVADLFGDG